LIYDSRQQSERMFIPIPTFIIVSFVVIFSCAAVFGQTSHPDTLVASPVQNIRVDGLLDEPAWSAALKIANFTQRELHEGEPTTEKTRAAILFSRNSLFIGFWAFDSEPDKIVAQEMKHDFSWDSDDNMKVIFSPFNDQRNGYLLRYLAPVPARRVGLPTQPLPGPTAGGW